MTKKLINRVLILFVIISFTIFLKNAISHLRYCEIDSCRVCENYSVCIFVIMILLIVILGYIIVMYFSGDFDDFFEEYLTFIICLIIILMMYLHQHRKILINKIKQTNEQKIVD